MVASFDKKRKKSNPGNKNVQGSLAHQNAGGGPMPIMDTPTSTPGVSNCYVFKSRLQEYAQKVGLPTPVYETIKEGPSHEPYFKSTVIVNDVRYDSLPGFFNRKAAEQSAAEVALVELSKCGEKKESISVPVHETGLCKNLLQEYAQKMNYAIPTYTCQKDDTPGRTPLFSCIVEIGGIQYIGATAKTKKEAEIKAARTALLAIRSSTDAAGEYFGGEHEYTVVPSKRKAAETVPPKVETVKRKKPKKPRLNKKSLKQRRPGNGGEQKAGNTSVSVNNDMESQVAVEQLPVNNDMGSHVEVEKLPVDNDMGSQVEVEKLPVDNDMGSQVEVEKLPVDNEMASQVAVEQLQNGQTPLASSAQDNGSSIINVPTGEVSTGDGGLVLQVSADCQEEPNPATVDAKPTTEENCSGVSEVQLHETE